MGKKRKSDATRLDEVDRGMYTTFCSAANSLSQLYSHAMHQQRLSFQAGERHSMEKLYTWILRQQEGGVTVMAVDIIAHIQNELDHATDEPPPSPRLPVHHQHQQPQTAMQLLHSGLLVSSNSFSHSTTILGQGQRLGNSDQTKNSVFSNALSSPVRQSLQNYHLSQGGLGYLSNSGNATRGNENTANQITRDNNPPSSNDTSMDMHADSPGHNSPY